MTRPLKVAYVLANLRAGGAERQVLALASRLPRARFTVDLIALIGAGPLDMHAREAGIKIHHAGSEPLGSRGRVRRVTGRAAKVGRLVSLVRRARYDIVDAWLYPVDVIATLTRPLHGAPVVIAGRRDLLPRDELGPLEGIAGFVATRFADVIVANSSAAAELAIQRHPRIAGKIRVIRNGVELIDPISDPRRQALRQSLGVAETDLVIGCVANYREVKQHGLLIRAFADLARLHPHTRLILVGEGPLRPQIEAQLVELGLERRVRVHGTALDPRPLYEAFDVVVQASRSEGMPNVVLEAAAASRPIVATAAGGTGEIVIDGQTGLLVPVGDASALTIALDRVVSDRELRRRLGPAARSHVERAFGMDRFVSEWADLYEDEMSRRRARTATAP